MIKVVDISHHQGEVDFNKMKAQGVSAVFIKCTQGTGFIDSRYKEYKSICRKLGISLGFYHFAGNIQKDLKTTVTADPIEEAKHFLRNIGDILPGEILILDWEPSISTITPSIWVSRFLDYVYGQVGFRPIFYTYEARLLKDNYRIVKEDNYGLWIAKYGLNNSIPGTQPKITPWDSYVLWQYTSKGDGSKYGVSSKYIDISQADITLDTLKKYGKPGITPEPPTDDLYLELFHELCEILNFDNFGDNMNKKEKEDITDEVKRLKEKEKQDTQKIIDLTGENAILKGQGDVISVIPPAQAIPKLTLEDLLKKLFKIN